MQWRDRQVLTMAVPSLRYAILRAKASKERCQLKRQRQEREERPLRQQKTRSSQGTASPGPNESKKRRGSCACRSKFSKQSRRRVCKNAENELRAAEREECQHFAAYEKQRSNGAYCSDPTHGESA